MGDTLDASARARLVKVFDTDADRMLQRAMKGKELALIHGDPNPTNVLTSNQQPEGRPPLFLIDRHPFYWSLRLWLGPSDLVYATVPFWPVEHRRALQKTLLLSYHEQLLANGVQTYSLSDLCDDWKICACMAAFTAIEWGSDPRSLKDMRWLWEKQLRRAVVFLEDCDADTALFNSLRNGTNSGSSFINHKRQQSPPLPSNTKPSTLTATAKFPRKTGRTGGPP